jgi:hypothetical protein
LLCIGLLEGDVWQIAGRKASGSISRRMNAAFEYIAVTGYQGTK